MPRKKAVTVSETPKVKGQQVGYVRVSTTDQSTARQLDGVELDKVFTEKVSGKNTARPQLQRLLEHVREGDTVHVHSLDRLARNLTDLRGLVDGLTGRGVAVRFHKEHLEFAPGGTSPMSTLLLHVMGAFAEFERTLILERQREGIEKAKEKGVYKGRKAALTPAQVQELHADIAGGLSKAGAARKYNIHRDTVYDYLKK